MQVVPVLNALASGLSGVAAFHLLGLPLPWLLGPVASCLLAALLGVPLGGIKPVNAAMRTVLGVAAGATLTPAVLATFPSMWPTLILMPLFVLATGAIGVPYFRRLCGHDFPTAYYASMPGGLQDMVAFGEEAGGNVRALSLIHATRVLVIVVALPFLLKAIWDADLDRPPGVPVTSVASSELALMALSAGFGWWAARRVGLFGATILGPMIVAAAVTLAGFLDQRPPAEAIWAAQFFIGMTIGGNYNGITMSEIRKDILAGLGFCGLLILLTLAFVEAIYSFGLAPGMSALLAYAPGGQAELTVLALVVGADMAFVVAHHILRIIAVVMGAPLAARLLDRRRK